MGDSNTPITDAISFPYVYGMNVERLYPEVVISIERITPDVAEKMLLANIGNRNIKREPIELALKSGEWSLNGATIVFDEKGNLIDGQHRLTACVKTGVPIDSVVVRGITRAAQDTMDSGVKRTLGDYLMMDGYKNYIHVAAIGTALYRVDLIGLTAATTKKNNDQCTIRALRAFVNENYETRIAPLIPLVTSVGHLYKGVGSGMLGALFDAFRRAGDENVDEFVEQLTNKKPACVSVRLLQNRLIENMTNKNMKYKPRTVAAFFIKAWNAFMSGDDIKKLTFNPGGANPERFPEVFLGYDS